MLEAPEQTKHRNLCPLGSYILGRTPSFRPKQSVNGEVGNAGVGTLCEKQVWG